MSQLLCAVCESESVKYKCPACSTETCSLVCTKTHKMKTACSGKRKKTEFIPRSKFDDRSINNDYNFLTSLECTLDNAARLGQRPIQGRNPNQAKIFVKRAKDLGEVNVVLAPRGMKRSRTNKSAWVPKKGQMSWTVEWVFEDTERRISDRVLDNVPLMEAVAFYKTKVDPVLDKIRELSAHELTFLIKNERIGDEGVTYTVLPPAKTLGQVLRHRTVVEFPTILCYSTVPAHMQCHRTNDQHESIQSVGQPIANEPCSGKMAGDFIALVADEEASDEGEEDRVDPAAGRLSAFGLPVLNFDDLEVSYT